MGSDWSWSLALPGDGVTTVAIERVLTIAEAAGLSPKRPDGLINGFDNTPGHEGEHRAIDPDELVHGLATGTWSTNLWNQSEVDIWLTTRSGTVTLSLDAVHCRRTPVAAAQPFRDLHHLLTELWVAIADETGALFGRVEDEWSLEQIWSELTDPASGPTPPPVGALPEWLSWSTYFDAPRYRRLPPLPGQGDATVRRTPGGAAVITLLTDPAAVDPVRFARLHHDYVAR
ncbi:MAG TPA: hypothetical protein VJ914_31415 [Pseudonocardiaceae bacterium]|nr:hypothetical protein [Pseudonocardiaceae bacterium]